MRKVKLILILFLLTFGGAPVLAAQAARGQRVDSVMDLWLDISMGPPLVDWFNRMARSDDIARVESIRQIDQLAGVKVGRKLVVFKSIAESEQLLPTLADKIDIIGYNLENGPGYPADEQADPVGSVKRMHDLAQQYDLPLAFGPDHRLALSDGVAIAPYVDILVLQVQRVQTEPDLARDFVLPLMPRLRRANPALQITVQVRTEGDVVAIVDLIDSIKDNLDGVSILTSPETVKVAEALVQELRTRKTLQPSSTTEPPAALTDRVQTGATVPVAPLPIQDSRRFWILMAGIALVAGAIGGGLIASLICLPRNRSSRK